MELRKYPRFRVQFRSTFSGNKIDGEGQVVDLSRGGCRIESESTVPSGIALELRLYAPDLNWPMRVEQAAVRWVSGREFGLEFVRLLPKEQETLQSLIKDLGQSEQE